MTLMPHSADFLLFTAGALWALAAVLLGALAPQDKAAKPAWLLIRLGLGSVALACFLALPLLALPGNPELPQAGLALAGVGFTLLLEGSRRAALATGAKLPGGWAVLLLVCLGLALGLRGWEGLRFGAVALALAAGAALALALLRQGWRAAAAWALAMALCMAGLALAAVTPLDFSQPGILLMLLFGLGGLSCQLWKQRCQRACPAAEGLLPRCWAMPLSFILLLLLGWLVTLACGSFTRSLQAGRYRARLELAHRLIQDHAALADRLAQDLAASLPGLRGPAVDQALDRVAALLPQSVAYVVDAKGRALASSNRGDGDSFVGQDYSLRPYITTAQAGRPGRLVALGLTSHRAGYYTSAPLTRFGKGAGVAVVKMALQPELALEPGEQGFILDRQGGVLLALAGNGSGRWAPAGKADLAPYSVESGVEGLRLVVLAPQMPIYAARLVGIGFTALLLVLVVAWALVRLSHAEMLQALKAGESRFKAVVEGIQELVYAFDARGIMTYVGPSVARYGYEPGQVLGRSMLDLVHPDDRAYVTAALGQILGQGQVRRDLGLPSLQFRILRADGGAVWFESVTGIQRGPRGEVLGISGILRDITERKQVEVERAQMQAQLIQSEKLASIGTLAAGVAHEINNPLAILKLNLANLRSLVDQAAAVAMMERMESAVDRVARIVGGLRVYARSSGEEQRPLDLHLLLQDTLALMEPILRKAGIEVAVDLACPKPVFLGNAGKMQQVMLNLLTNARDAVEGLADARIQLSTRAVEGGIEFRVADNGPGVSQAIQQRIFEPFFSTKGVGKGTGLGLSISHGIIAGMGGQLRLESREGHGAVFCVEIPRAAAPSPAFEEAAAPAPVLRSLAGKALVVDDEPEIRQSLSQLLKSLGLQVAEAADGEAALEILRHEGFDWVITDQKMPRMAGDELVSRARALERCKQTRFVVITGGEPADLPPQRRDRLAQPGVSILLKPFSTQDIIQALRQA
jgi:PAS domain S-box-containing protein